MLFLVTGGSASGKSALAEGYCAALQGPLLYVATLIPCDAESRARIKRHQEQRARRGFKTLECHLELDHAVLSFPCRTALLECLGTLTANEMFRQEAPLPPELVAKKIRKGVDALYRQVEHLVVVSNEVFGDGMQYPRDTAQYMEALGKINCSIAAVADVVVEAVCGLPLIHKGGERLS